MPEKGHRRFIAEQFSEYIFSQKELVTLPQVQSAMCQARTLGE